MYARQVPQPPRATATTAAAIVVIGVGAYAVRTYFSRQAFAESEEPPMAFSGGIGFTSLRLHSVKIVNHNVKRLRFELPDPNARSGLSLTSALLTFSRPHGSLFPAIRPYTPISDFNEPGFIELMVKQYPNGRASSHIHSLTPGQSLSFGGPIKGYPWTPNKHSHINLIAGGMGITPMYQLIQGILKDPDDKTKITLVLGANTDADIVLRDELDEFQKRFPDRLKVVYTVSNPTDGSPFQKGYITKALLEKEMVGPQEKNVKVFLCGPPAMEATMTSGKGWFGGGEKGILEQLGYTKDQIYKF